MLREPLTMCTAASPAAAPRRGAHLNNAADHTFHISCENSILAIPCNTFSVKSCKSV